jgi:hypothetical protein
MNGKDQSCRCVLKKAEWLSVTQLILSLSKHALTKIESAHIFAINATDPVDGLFTNWIAARVALKSACAANARSQPHE